MERWIPVVGFEGMYEVSSRGRVRGIDRLDGQGRNWPGRELRLQSTRGGYKYARLSNGQRKYMKRVNRLVLTAFRRAPASGEEAAHLNGIRTDNRVANLRWKTRLQNEVDKRVHGTLLLGERCPWAKLTVQEVIAIRARKAAGENFADIARALRKPYHAVYSAGTGRNWREA